MTTASRSLAPADTIAVLHTLNAELLGHDSATLTLERWRATHRLAVPARITAQRDHSVEKAATPAQRRALCIGDTEPIRYRHVWLRCGAHVLSEADNWYVPSRLTEQMNRRLETSQDTFGRAVQGLEFSRHTTSAKILWSLVAGEEQLDIPVAVLCHEAILALPDGTPFSLLVRPIGGTCSVFRPRLLEAVRLPPLGISPPGSRKRRSTSRYARGA